MNELIFFVNKVLISGAAVGSVYAMGAIGVTLVFGIMRFAHFAHGDMMTLGAYLALLAVGLCKAWASLHSFLAARHIRTELAMAREAG